MTSPKATQQQVARLVDLGVAELLGTTGSGLARLADGLGEGGLVALHPDTVPARTLAGLLQHAGRPGFVVEDMTDLEAFAPVVDLPPDPLYLVHDLDRGDDLRSWSPDEAGPHLAARGRTPLTLHEGISWLLQEPERLEPGACFMTTASRLTRADGRLDPRTPAIWISGGTGRDGRERKGAPKVGWCWAGNRHTWLGVASAGSRSGRTGAH